MLGLWVVVCRCSYTCYLFVSEALRLQNQIDVFENALQLFTLLEGNPEGLSEEATSVLEKLNAQEVVRSHNYDMSNICVCLCFLLVFGSGKFQRMVCGVCQVDYPSTTKLKLLAAVVRGELKMITTSDLPPEEAIVTLVHRIDPYEKGTPDSQGNTVRPVFAAINPMLHSIDDDTASRLSWSAMIFTENILAHVIARGEPQVAGCRKTNWGRSVKSLL